MMPALALKHAGGGKADVGAVLVGPDAVPKFFDALLTEAGVSAAAAGGNAVQARLDGRGKISCLHVAGGPGVGDDHVGNVSHDLFPSLVS